jgi:ferritin-like metal-binding protein YciE
VERLEETMRPLDTPARGKKCEGMEGLLEEGEEMLEKDG